MPDDGELRARAQSFRYYVKAARRFKELLSEESAVYETRMQAGECVIFDNRRFLHARTAFTVGEGDERWFRGCYVDGDAWRSAGRMIDDEALWKLEMPPPTEFKPNV